MKSNIASFLLAAILAGSATATARALALKCSNGRTEQVNTTLIAITGGDEAIGSKWLEQGHIYWRRAPQFMLEDDSVEPLELDIFATVDKPALTFIVHESMQ